MLSHQVLLSTAQDLSFLFPFNQESRFRKLTVENDAAALFTFLALQVFNDYDRKNWGLNQLDEASVS